MYVLFLSAINCYICTASVLGLTFDRTADWGSHRICGIAGYMYDAEGPWG
jgi:hypothetical protein